mmetsp:Transcript_11648/g.34534  ORF Transcript_11648/g.34534 Transcript_11648/m.34534 type:complete len:283 (+) Transcript_11648:380-1228(+)
MSTSRAVRAHLPRCARRAASGLAGLAGPPRTAVEAGVRQPVTTQRPPLGAQRASSWTRSTRPQWLRAWARASASWRLSRCASAPRRCAHGGLTWSRHLLRRRHTPPLRSWRWWPPSTRRRWTPSRMWRRCSRARSCARPLPWARRCPPWRLRGGTSRRWAPPRAPTWIGLRPPWIRLSRTWHCSLWDRTPPHASTRPWWTLWRRSSWRATRVRASARRRGEHRCPSTCRRCRPTSHSAWMCPCPWSVHRSTSRPSTSSLRSSCLGPRSTQSSRRASSWPSCT